MSSIVMDTIRPQLRDEYRRWFKKLGRAPLGSQCVISMDDVLRAHYLLVDYFIEEGEEIGLCGPRDANLLVSAISRQATGFGGLSKWQEPLARCATLFFGLIKDHPFHDGNKRTALLVALHNLYKIKRTPDAPQKEFERLALRTASNRLSDYSRYRPSEDDAEVCFIRRFLQKRTRPMNKRMYVITYRDLDRILRHYGHSLDNPSGNCIDVCRTVEEKRGILGRRRQRSKKKVLQIGFPRWTAQVGLKAMKSVLAKTGLTPERGYDSEVVFHDAEPLGALIDSYRGPLKRLKDR